MRLADFSDAIDRGFVSRQHNLRRLVVVRHLTDIALRRFGSNFHRDVHTDA